MSTETNKTIAQRFVQAVNQQNLAELDEMLTPILAQEWKKLFGSFFSRNGPEAGPPTPSHNDCICMFHFILRQIIGWLLPDGNIIHAAHLSYHPFEFHKRQCC